MHMQKLSNVCRSTYFVLFLAFGYLCVNSIFFFVSRSMGYGIGTRIGRAGGLLQLWLCLQDLVKLTAGLFDACVSLILDSGGTVDKFIGDCIMAFWGAPQRLQQPARSMLSRVRLGCIVR